MADETVNVGLGMGEPENVPQLQLGAEQEQGVPAIALNIEVPDTVYAKRSEAWAIGTINGEPVPETDPAYHNNSRYYAIQSAVEDAIDDTAGEGDTDKVWSADKTYTEISGLGEDIAEAVAEVDEKLTGKAPVIIDSASGSIASFPDGADDLPVKTLTVGIEPVQDLHGYDSPWPAGGGKNLVDYLSCVGVGARDGTESIYGNNVSVSGDVITISQSYAANGGLLKGIKHPSLDENTLFTVSFEGRCTCSNLLFGYGIFEGGGTNQNYSIDVTENTWTTITRTFTAQGGAIGLFLQPSFLNSTLEVRNLQLEVGSSATAYTPYSNICPISGWTGANVSRTGVNVWDEEWESGIITDSGDQSQDNSIRSKNYNMCYPSTEYYKYQGTGFSGYPVIVWYDSNKNLISRNTSSYQLCTSPANARYFRISMYNYGTTYNHDISINYPATDTQYHPGQVEQISYPFPNSAGTVYGGTLTVHQDGTGTLVVDKVTVIFDGTESGWTASGSYPGSFFINIGATPWASRSDEFICSHAEKNRVFPANYKLGEFGFDGTTRDIFNVFVMPAGTTYAEFGAWLAEQYANGTPLQICYPLATPVTYELTALEVIATLKGSNNVWADTGDTTADYPADTKLYIDGKIAELQALILENINNA